jgi:hypothetical protein
MPSIKLALERQGPKRLEVSWDLGWKNTIARLDGQEVGRIATHAELKAGREFPLPDGSRLHLQLKQAGLAPQLAVLHNGMPLPGSGADPETVLKNAAGCAYFIGGLGVVLGALAASGVQFLQKIGFTGYDVGFGLLFLALGYFIGRRSTIALGFAVGIYGIVSIAALGAGTAGGGGIFMRIILLIGMWQGFGAIRELNARGATPLGAGGVPPPMPSGVPSAPQPVVAAPQPVTPAPQPQPAPVVPAAQPIQPVMPRTAPPIPNAANQAQPGTLALQVSTGRTVPLSDGGWLSVSDLPGLQSTTGTGVAEVCRNPNDPSVHGLRNQSQSAWTAYMPNGSVLQVPPGKTVRLATGVRIDFGMVSAEVAVSQAAPVEVNTVW